MSISREDFEIGLDDEVKKVLHYLSENKDKAFTSKELSKTVELEWDKVKQILRYLTERKNITFKDIGSSRYYLFRTSEQEKEKKRRLFS